MTERKAVYTIRIKTKQKSEAEKILNHIDEMMLWFEKLFPNIEVSV